MLVEVYDNSAPIDKLCREWFRRFKISDLTVEDKLLLSGQTKKFEYKILEALLNEDPREMQEELAESLRWLNKQFPYKIYKI